MILIKPSQDGGNADRDLTAAEAHLSETLASLEDLKRSLKEGDLVQPEGIRRAVSDYSRAVQTIFDERKRLEDKRKRAAGVVHEFALDFAAARDEIGRRLDSLRAAGCSDEVSE